MSVRLLAVFTLITAAALPLSAHAAYPESPTHTATSSPGRCELRQVADLITYHPESINGCGLLLDLAAVDRSETLSLSEKRTLANPFAWVGDSDQREKLLEDKKYQPFFKLVRVQATLGKQPATRGEILPCRITSLSGQSIAGGYLIATTLLTPEGVKAGRAAGFVEAESDAATGTLVNGMRLEALFQHPIVRNGRVLIRLKKQYAGVVETTTVRDLIQGMYRDCFIPTDQWNEEAALEYVKTVDASRISVEIPEVYAADPYTFAAQLMELGVYDVGYEEVASAKAAAAVK
ncbi:hypothetical protein Pla123a_03380 [Posidoniimonas polymericola]|uniref:Uncharacterized protein n=1 Tax=Posidoniimonas polymericola TaxID=2528002 RepID=A0A5C5ZFB4_9BACT|nr:hypothetical protein [Posidoniimonas polymericola]TWT85531.1 hypothetical protein Pla123a_03380 [Posidoniimonas polymericola]